MNVAFKRSFARDLKPIKDKALLKRVQEIIEEVERADTLSELSSVKKLQGSDHYYRIRLGDYRIGLLVTGDTVTFVRFLHRKDIYRYFP
ncbi:MAG: type II toxin-antitoxin system RelE/ParE family toxin [Chloroflexi bacterium]|nr:type II toxin-antitoxin system RelE/ParE family toxin [Chloroflexota bacterium]MCI0576661.1 type II toxin-antitoxin system RelE/ParE family toxin [Chloroflexota bacterium]MCI0647974.1 type II toxin-antitoxin system RelE/ParE family toxin [Chloroflexota bacterium]MCI0726816.1 type II toxin-antitoxin system RelE/ParE family toxin [Chloroflexota bacterium]